MNTLSGKPKELRMRSSLIILMLLWCATAQADLPDEQTIIHCGLAEARDQGLEGLTAVFEAIRNRGTLFGVYGCKARFSEPQWVWDMGWKAWEASKTSNLVKGADHFHNVVREGETYWTVKMTKTVCIKDHCFYK